MIDRYATVNDDIMPFGDILLAAEIEALYSVSYILK